jgi:putative MATE family efflux protein
LNQGLKLFGKYVSANLLGMIGFSCYILADTFFVARGLGSNGLAALNLGLVMYTLMTATGQMIGIGAGTRYGVAKARRDTEEMNRSFTQAVYMVIFASVVFLSMGIFYSESIVRFLGADEDTFHMTNTYLSMIYLFSPAFLWNQVMNCFVRNDENPGLAMKAMLVGSLVNTMFDYIFIFPLNMGMFGGVLATCMCPISSLCVLSIHVIKRKQQFHFCRCMPSFTRVVNICGLGMAAFINDMSSAITMFLFNWTILGLEGNLGVAAYGVVSNLAYVAVYIFTGIAQGVQPIISDAYGRKDNVRVKLMYRYAVTLTLIIAVVTYAVIFLFTSPIAGAFNREGDMHLQELAVFGLKLYFIGFLFGGINIVTSSYFGAIEKVRKSFIVSILRGFVVIVPVLLILAKFAGMTGVWMTFPCTELLVLAVSVCFMRKEKMTWKGESV